MDIKSTLQAKSSRNVDIPPSFRILREKQDIVHYNHFRQMVIPVGDFM